MPDKIGLENVGRMDDSVLSVNEVIGAGEEGGSGVEGSSGVEGGLSGVEGKQLAEGPSISRNVEITQDSPIISSVDSLSHKINSDKPITQKDLLAIQESIFNTEVKVGSRTFTLKELRELGKGMCEFLLSLPTQYETAFNALKVRGILESGASQGSEGLKTSWESKPSEAGIETQEGTEGITGVDGNFYPIPTLDDITEMLTKSPESIEKYNLKIEQGFKELNLIPFAMPIGTNTVTLKRNEEDNSQIEYHEYTGLLKAYTDILRDLAQSETFTYLGTIKPKPKGCVLAEGANPDSPITDKDAWVQVDSNYPLWTWDQIPGSDLPESPNPLYYYPQSFERENTGGEDEETNSLNPNKKGLTKPEILNNQNTTTPGWEITLNQPSTLIPNQGEGKTIHGRKQIEAGLTPIQYLNLLQTSSEYNHESGMTVESALTQAIYKLLTHGQVTNDFYTGDKEKSGEGKGKLNFLIGNFIQNYVPDWFWDRDAGYRRAGLGWDDPGYSDSDYGVSSAVRITA